MNVAEQLLWESQPEEIKAAARAYLTEEIAQEIENDRATQLDYEQDRVVELEGKIEGALQILDTWRSHAIATQLGEEYDRVILTLRKVGA